MDNSGWDERRKGSLVAEGLESPFLKEEVFNQGRSQEWERLVTRLEAETPFGKAFEHAQGTASYTESLNSEFMEWETGASQQTGVSNVAAHSIKQWPDHAKRPTSWQGKIYGLVVHTSGSGIPKRAEKDNVSPTKWAMDYYKNSRGCHYVNGWGGIENGDLIQIANESIEAWGVGFSNTKEPQKDQRRSILAGRFELDLPSVLIKHWRKRWPTYKNSLELLPGTKTANSCYVHVECLPCVYHGQKGGLTIGAPPLQTRPKLRFTKAQHDAVAQLAIDIARRNGWPATETWWRSPRLLGHEDLTPISRHDKNGGWDPGYLRDEPYFDWDYVYGVIESLLQGAGAAPATLGSSIGSGILSALGNVAQGFADLVRAGKEGLAISLAYRQGTTDENKLTSLVFHARHPELGGRRIRKEEPSLAQEWLKIREGLVRPFLQSTSASKAMPELQEAFLEESELLEPFVTEWEDLNREDPSTESFFDIAGEEKTTVDLEESETDEEFEEDEFTFDETTDEIEMEDVQSEEDFSDDAEFEPEEEEFAKDYEASLYGAEGIDNELFIGSEQDELAEEQELDERFGKSIYLPIKLNNTVLPKVGVFIPSSFRPTTSVDLIVYFHGHMIPACEKNPKKFDEAGMEHYWNTPLFKNLREELAASGKQAVLIAPTLAPFLARSSAGYGNLNQSGKFDQLITETISHLEAKGILPAGAKAQNIILSGHSGGGLPMLELLSAKNNLRENIKECWGFECLYFGTDGWARWLKSDPQHYFIHFRQPSYKKEQTAILNKYQNFKDVPTAKGHCGIIKEKWQEAIQKSRVFSGELVRSSPSASVEQPSGLLSLLMALPGFSNFSSSFLGALMNGNRDENHLTNLIFFNRHPELEGRKLTASDPQSLKNEWIEIRQLIVRPALRRIQEGRNGLSASNSTSSSLPAPQPTSAARKTSISDAKRAELIAAAIQQATTAGDQDDRQAIAQTLKLNGSDVKTWFSDIIPDATFLGRSIRASGGKVPGAHRSLFEVLQRAEKMLLDAHPGRTAEELGKDFNIYDIAGVRPPKKATGGTLPSYHCFGLAIDINHDTNPFVGNQKGPPGQREKYKPYHSPAIIHRAMWLLRGQRFDVEKPVPSDAGEAWDIHRRASEALAEYLRLADNVDSPQVQKLVAEAQARGDTNGLEWWKFWITKDRSNIKNWDFQHHPNPQQRGYMDLPRQLVVTLVTAGLTWGGQYRREKDMMHFDLRSGPITKRE